ncbi:hypothetical protein JSE7799_01227 [Jannaschia seosinensis]|uniref:Uncharacterized protein n=1 Tax=Jannaschia seosinensis TaxID=313367 RepID=A0A0M7B9M3_9RHOB|nr:DUF6478 family protein [Jannaschia seosinensis]CUH36693.1 hypothetical protein JSE7799_01227 [Jannaschia seosinensis]
MAKRASRLIARLRGSQPASAGSPRPILPGQDGIEWPAQCDWAWRPAPWAVPIAPNALEAARDGTALCAGATVFHDGTAAALHQRPGPGPAPYALSLELGGFDGTFLSLAIDLPHDAATTLRRNHILRVRVGFGPATPVNVYARLNIRHGPNTEQMLAALAPEDEAATAEFDLGLQAFNTSRLVKAWLDLILERPVGGRLAIADVALARRPRAEL